MLCPRCVLSSALQPYQPLATICIAPLDPFSVKPTSFLPGCFIASCLLLQLCLSGMAAHSPSELRRSAVPSHCHIKFASCAVIMIVAAGVRAAVWHLSRAKQCLVHTGLRRCFPMQADWQIVSADNLESKQRLMAFTDFAPFEYTTTGLLPLTLLP